MNVNLLKPNRRLNDDERAEWVENDELLYDTMIQSRLGLKAFVKRNREFLDQYINIRLGN